MAANLLVLTMPCRVQSLVSLFRCANKLIRGSRFEANPQSAWEAASQGRHFCIQIRDQLRAVLCPQFKYSCRRLEGITVRAAEPHILSAI